MDALIEFQNVTLGYGKKIVLRDLNLRIESGGYLGLVGPNGAGKTTLVRAILGTLKPHNGSIRTNVPQGEKLRFGYVPQRESIDYVLPYTVYEIVMMGRYHEIGLFHRPKKSDHEIVTKSLQQVGIENLRDRSYKNISGGQRQRTLIARALACEPLILVLDEPTNGMDLSSRVSILELISSLHEDRQRTVIMVSHLLDDVANYVKRIALVENDSLQIGTVDEVLTEKNLSSLYGMPVKVGNLNGSTVIHAGGRHGNE